MKSVKFGTAGLRILALGLLIAGVRLGTAHAIPPAGCIGACTVHCESGATLHYATPSWQCCSKSSNCPDGGYAEWWPGSGAACRGEFALICA